MSKEHSELPQLVHEAISRAEIPLFSAEPYVDSQAAAKFLRVGARTLNEMARRGIVPAYPWGVGKQRKTWRFRVSELDAWMRSRVQSKSRSLLPEMEGK